MDDIKQNSLANKLLNILRIWIDDIIPQQTKNCIRSKVAIVVASNPDKTYDVVLSEDFGEYLELVAQKDSGELNPTQFEEEVAKISIDNLFSIKEETYVINDYVIVGYLDDKLTNSFILCKNRGQGGI